MRMRVSPIVPALGASIAMFDRAVRGTIDVETRTEENYQRCLRLHVLPRWAAWVWVRSPRQRCPGG
jgi:hypothetical protein